MRKISNGRNGHALLAATAAMVLASSALAQTAQPVYFDTNGSTAGLSKGAGNWDTTTANWATDTTGTTDATWTAGNIAAFDGTAAYTVTITEPVSVGGIEFLSNFSNNISYSGSGELDIGDVKVGSGGTPFTVMQTIAAKQMIFAPIVGSGDLVFDLATPVTQQNTAQLTLAGDLSRFTGDIYVNNTFSAASTINNSATIHIDQPVSSATTIYLDQNTTLTNSNQLTDPVNGTLTPNIYTIAGNVVLNYNGVAEEEAGTGGTNTQNFIGNSAGPSGDNKIMTLSGVISSPAGVVSNLTIGGGGSPFAGGVHGTVILANHETYNGSTTIDLEPAGGMVQLAHENALPSTTNLTIGATGEASVGVTDLDGYDETVASLSSGVPSSTTPGDIYNLTINNESFVNSDSSTGYSMNTANNGVQTGDINSGYVTLTISPATATNTVFVGDIGSTNLSTTTYSTFGLAPYSGTNPDSSPVTTANQNISLVINGPSAGGTHTFTLAPVGSKGDEYSGTTTVNSNATLVFGRTTAGTLSSGTVPNYTITGNGQITVGSGATLSTLSTAAGTYAGGTAGNIVLQKGSSFLPGQATLSGTGATTTAALSASNIGTFATSNIEWDSGSSMTFTLASTSSYDTVDLLNSDGSTGTLALANPTNDATPTYTLNINGSNLISGNYQLLTGNISGDQTNSDSTSKSITLDTSGVTGGGLYKILDNGSGLVLQVLTATKVLQWDPTGGGTAGGFDGDVNEGGGTWNDSSPFVNLSSNGAEVTWNNTDYSSYDVLIGNDPQQGDLTGPIHLGENITVGGVLRFQSMFPGYNYSIANDGFTLTLNGGIALSTGAAISNGSGGFSNPSAEIDTPIALGADQTWQINSGEYLLVKGTLSGSHALTVSGINGGASTGIIDLQGSGGSISSLAVQGGIIWLTAPGAIGNAPITLNGGGVEFAVNGTPSNAISFGSNGGSLGALAGYSIVVPGNLSTTGMLGVIGAGNTAFTGNLSANQFNIASTGTVILNGTNTFTNGLYATAGTIQPASAASLGTGPLTLINANLALTNISSLANNIVTAGTSSLQNNAVITSNVNLEFDGVISGQGNLILPSSSITYTLAGSNTLSQVNGGGTAGGAINVQGTNDTLHVTNPSGLGTGVLVDSGSTLTVEIDDNPDGSTLNVTDAAIRTNTTANTVNKTGAGTWTMNGYSTANSIAGSTFNLEGGEVVLLDYRSLGSTATNNLNLNMSPGTILAADFNSGSTRTGGSVTLNGATIIHDLTSTGDTYFASSSVSDVWSISGNSKIDEAENGVTTNAVMRLSNPIVVNSGAVLTLESDDATHNTTDDSLVVSGPGNITDTNTTTTPDTYITFTIQSGATVVNTGPGSVRFGQTGSHGIAIIGQGAPNASLPNNGESLLQLGNNFFMVDTGTTNELPATELVVDGTGSEGLRIEAPMNAAYTSASVGTTGLFGINSYSPASGNGYTVYSPNRAMNLSTPYNYVDVNNNIIQSITPSGTLTLAATDAAGATGLINDGPAVQSNVSLALANGTGSGGKLIYQISAATNANGGSFGNFAGLTVEQNSATSNAHVVAQLKDNTKVPTLSITGGASVDITNQALVVDAGTGAPPTAQIEAYLKSAYDKGNWDGPGIGTSNTQLGTSIGYVENDALATPFSSSILFGGAGGQAVSNSAVLVLDTWLGDLNLDGVVDSTDFGLMGNIPTSGPLAGQIGWFDGDLNYDGVINADDYSLFQLGDAAQTGTRTSAVPEPAAISLLAIGGGAMLRRRRRAFN